MVAVRSDLLSAALAGTLAWGGAWGDDALSFVEFSYDFDGQCVARDGKMMRVHNAHASRDIKAYLYRYYGGVRQPGRTRHILAAGGEEVALGCTLISGRPQHWKAVEARFLD